MSTVNRPTLAGIGLLCLSVAVGAVAQESDCTVANALLEEGERGFPQARSAEADEDGFLDWVWGDASWCRFHDVRSEKFVALDCGWEWDEGQVSAAVLNNLARAFFVRHVVCWRDGVGLDPVFAVEQSAGEYHVKADTESHTIDLWVASGAPIPGLSRKTIGYVFTLTINDESSGRRVPASPAP
jgi:hypothetical protein